MFKIINRVAVHFVSICQQSTRMRVSESLVSKDVTGELTPSLDKLFAQVGIMLRTIKVSAMIQTI